MLPQLPLFRSGASASAIVKFTPPVSIDIPATYHLA
nr:MAG TPA: Seven transmembrane helix receptor, peptide, ECD1, Agonist, Family B1 [Caudoviricetes sp.]